MKEFDYSELPNTTLIGLDEEVVRELAAFYSAETDRYHVLKGNMNTFVPTVDDISKKEGKKILSRLVALMEPMPRIVAVKVLDNGFNLVFRCKNINNETINFILNYGSKYDYSPRIIAIKNGKVKVSEFNFNDSVIKFEPGEYEVDEHYMRILDEAISEYKEQQSYKKVKKYRR